MGGEKKNNFEKNWSFSVVLQFRTPDQHEINVAAMTGLPVIESSAGGRDATRLAITGGKRNNGLVGAANLSIEAYAQEVRDSYKALKKRRRDAMN